MDQVYLKDIDTQKYCCADPVTGRVSCEEDKKCAFSASYFQSYGTKDKEEAPPSGK